MSEDAGPSSGDLVSAINALPHPVRAFVHDLETRCDPAGEVRELFFARQEVTALRARLARVERERDIREELVIHAAGRIADFEQRVAALTEALRKYGRHSKNCGAWPLGGEWRDGDQTTCDCGLARGLLPAARPQRPTVADDRPFRDFTDDQLVLLALGGIKVTSLGDTATEEDAALMARALEFMVGAEIHARGLHPREHYRALARRAGEALKTYLRNVVPIEPERN